MEISSRLIRCDILYFLYFTTLIASVAISWRLALVTYIPVNRPVFFFTLFWGIPLISTLLAVRRNLQKKKRIWTVFIAALVIISLAFGINSFRYKELNESYVWNDTPFNSAAREIMPELSHLSEAEHIEHYHGRKYGEEWVVLKAVFTSEGFAHHLTQIEDAYSFYAPGEIKDAPFSLCENPFVTGSYQFYVLTLQEYENDPSSHYGAAIGLNEADSSVIYLFTSSDVYSSMGVDGVVSEIWRYLGVSKQ